jgi:uncharacterized protein YhfF
MDWQELETFSFGDSPALADELAGLVLAGIKTATCWAAVDGLKTEPGKLTVMLGGNGRPLAIIETVELALRRFDEVDASFAYDKVRTTELSPPGARHTAAISPGWTSFLRI